MTREASTFCRICEAACGLRVELDDRGQPVAIRPDRAHPVSAGFACAKGTRFLEVAHHRDRLLYPQRRRDDGTLERCSWDEALALAGSKLRAIAERHGPHAIGVYFGNPIAFNLRGAIATFRFAKALGSRNVFSSVHQDCANKFTGADIVHGSPVIHPIPDFEHCDLAVMFGTNPAVSQSSFVHLPRGSLTFDALVDRGANVVWIDPRKTESARRWGEHLAIRPGTDAFLLLALLDRLAGSRTDDAHASGLSALLEVARRFPVERVAAITGLSVEAIERLAERIRTSRASAFHMSVGVNQGPFGTLSYVLLHALAYVTGNLDRKGGVLFHPLAVRAAGAMRWAGIDAQTQRSRIGGFTSLLEQLPAGIMADEMLTEGDGRLRALVVIAGDPLRSIPGESRLRKALAGLEFLASIDLFENDTGKLAHLLLPSTTWLERGDVATTTAVLQHAPMLQTSRPIVDAPAETRPEAWILSKLLGAMGKGGATRWFERLPIDRWIPSSGHGIRVPGTREGSYLGRGPRTQDHRLRFWDARVENECQRLESAAHALVNDGFVLISRRRRLGHNSWMHGGVRDGDPERAAWMAREDLAKLGVESGGAIAIRSREGTLRIDAQAHESVPRGVVVVPHGIHGSNVNAIIPSGAEALEPASGQHRMTGIAVRVERA